MKGTLSFVFLFKSAQSTFQQWQQELQETFCIAIIHSVLHLALWNMQSYLKSTLSQKKKFAAHFPFYIMEKNITF